MVNLKRYIPSYIDVLLAGMLSISWLPQGIHRSIFFIFYSILLFIITLPLKPKREFKSVPLSLLLIWCMGGLFLHSFMIAPPSALSYYYRNFNLMTEGFLYLLAGALFVRTVVMYSTQLKFTYFLIPIALLPWLNKSIYFGKSTQIVALGLSLIIYTFLTRRYRWSLGALFLGLAGVVAKWSWLCMKFRCRPYGWLQMIINSFYHPVRRDATNILDPGLEFSPAIEKFLSTHVVNYQTIKPWLASLTGSGFSQYLGRDYVWVDYKVFGWVHRQNDFLHFMECTGVIGLGLLVWFLVECLRKIGIQPALIVFMTVLLVCVAQLTMFSIGTGGVCLAILAYTLADGIKNKEEVLL